MIDDSIFREYDIRGIFNQNLTQEVVFKIGYLIGQRINSTDDATVVIGHDARVHSLKLYEWLKDGLCSSGIKVYFIGLVPTPVAYFATCNSIDSIHSVNSIMITGSHNPPEYNGFKITLNKKPFYGSAIRELGKELINLSIPIISSSMPITSIDALDAYKKYLINHFKSLKNFPYKIVLDYGNGVGAVGMEDILDALRIQHDCLFPDPDGNFPAHHPDPSEEKNLIDIKNHMSKNNIKIGLAFDGDADRIALLSTHHSYKGDELAILFAKQIAKDGTKPLIIGEVKCSQIMYDEINKIGQSVMYKTGHSNLKVKLKELNAHLAAEMSGHLFFNDRYFGYDDAIYAGLRALELFLDHTPEEIEKIIQTLPEAYSTPEEKIITTEEEKFIIIEKLHQMLKNPPSDFPKMLDIVCIDGIRVIFEDGWGLVRASNTTPVLVTRFEAKSKNNANKYKKSLLALIETIKKSL
ncbi:phosphomannomutase/phosphoglucomutase [Helicobacter cappadocius]|uniref:Phosphomannomutase/phosphoglucomutase n=1 Tax=Helicobacter cappadocius TaxID=3063998 RepID=A0AA90Q3Q6_9HELI|nr:MULTISPECIES: phosphomannomutase/phosphoglucomutase [unclassified Helicobacter]MDO7253719.1 phosphomannomutase/phosphoglucomutase [Helicobacter sp. faydin-H75]MDP2539593.1 phosphomannomutase/phosphoglucomutase [Helicobacter sp. faydin-H76]